MREVGRERGIMGRRRERMVRKKGEQRRSEGDGEGEGDKCGDGVRKEGSRKMEGVG